MSNWQELVIYLWASTPFVGSKDSLRGLIQIYATLLILITCLDLMYCCCWWWWCVWVCVCAHSTCMIFVFAHTSLGALMKVRRWLYAAASFHPLWHGFRRSSQDHQVYAISGFTRGTLCCSSLFCFDIGSLCNPSWLSPLFSRVLEFQIWDTWSHVLLKMAVFNFLTLWHATVTHKVHAQELHDGVTKKLPKTPHNVFSTFVILCWPCQVVNDSRLCKQESFFLSWLFSVISFFFLL